MRGTVFSTKIYAQRFLSFANKDNSHELHFFEPRLTTETASLAHNFPVVCVFVNAQLDRHTLR
jgi:D-lactate dehydrogenase